MKIETILAIDPGASGGLALYGNGKVSVAKMPKDLGELKQYFEHLTETYTNIVCFIERVSGYRGDNDAPGKWYGIDKMLANFTELKTSLKFHDIPFIEVHPATWQAGLRLRVKGEDKKARKNRYKDFAEKTYPEIKTNLWNADALCILQFARIKINIDPGWVEDRMPGVKNKLL